MNGAGVRRQGGCITTAIDLHFGWEKDPLVTARIELLATWTDVMRSSGGIRAGICSALYRHREYLRGEGRWRRVAGPVAAVVATLYDLGWEPRAADMWLDDLGQAVSLEELGARAQTEVRRLVGASVRRHLHQRADAWYQGTGLGASGADMTCIRRAHRKALADDPLRAGAIDCVVQGAYWTKDRKHEAGYTDALCEACGAIDTPLHSLGECPALAGFAVPAIQRTQALIGQAQAEAGKFSCFWLRGLPPAGWTSEHPDLKEYVSFREYWSPGDGGEIHEIVGTSVCIGTDGSGGMHARDPRLRRCGWGWVALSVDTMLPCAAGRGTVPGRQTVPRAELAALVDVIAHTSGDLLVAIDNEPTIKAYRRGPGHCCSSHNGDLWCVLFQLLGNRNLQLEHVHSHKAAEDFPESRRRMWLANGIADGLAECAADKAQLSSAVCDRVHASDLRTSLVLERLAAITSLHAAGGCGRPPGPRLVRFGPPTPSRSDLLAAAAAHGHVAGVTGSEVVCSACHQRTSVKGCLAHRWWLEHCSPEQTRPAFHCSHRGIVFVGGWWVCPRCGSRSAGAKISGLGRPCRVPTASGMAFLRRVGLLPKRSTRGRRPK